MDDTVQNCVTSHCSKEGYAGRIDVVTGPSGRRRWPEHVKAEIVLESYRDDNSVADVARKHGCVFRRIRPSVPTTCAHLFRGIRPPVTRCREAAYFGYQS